MPLQLDGLPESTAEWNHDLLKKAMDGLAAPFAAFLADAVAGGRRPDWIINDFCHHWVPSIAAEHNTACALFHIVPAAMNASNGPRWANAEHPIAAPEDFTVPPAWIPFPSTIVYRRHGSMVGGRRLRGQRVGHDAVGHRALLADRGAVPPLPQP